MHGYGTYMWLDGRRDVRSELVLYLGCTSSGTPALVAKLGSGHADMRCRLCRMVSLVVLLAWCGECRLLVVSAKLVLQMSAWESAPSRSASLASRAFLACHRLCHVVARIPCLVGGPPPAADKPAPKASVHKPTQTKGQHPRLTASACTEYCFLAGDGEFRNAQHRTTLFVLRLDHAPPPPQGVPRAVHVRQKGRFRQIHLARRKKVRGILVEREAARPWHLQALMI